MYVPLGGSTTVVRLRLGSNVVKINKLNSTTYLDLPMGLLDMPRGFPACTDRSKHMKLIVQDLECSRRRSSCPIAFGYICCGPYSTQKSCWSCRSREDGSSYRPQALIIICTLFCAYLSFQIQLKWSGALSERDGTVVGADVAPKEESVDDDNNCSGTHHWWLPS